MGARGTNTSPISQVAERFDRLARTGEWARLYTAPDGNTYHFHVRRSRVLELLPERLGRVADIGCGPGVMVGAVLERGGTFEGVDCSPAMVQDAAERFQNVKGVVFRQGSIEALELSSDTYDQVICMAVIEYLETPDRALAEISRILRAGGQAVVTIPKRRHIDRLPIAATAPIRALARVVGFGTADALPRLCLQPSELDAAARRAGLIPDGGSQYHFTLLPYPFTRICPNLCMRLNLSYERWHATRSPGRSFFAHGYVGRYRKPD